jgi:5-methylcytosine-specific restriction endonuclease McrA
MGRKINQGSKWITKKRRKAIYIRDDLKCVYCGKGIEDGIIFTLDHLVPCELGGDNSTKNLVTCCLSCNSSKQDKPLKEFLVYLSDQGIDVQNIRKVIRRNTQRKLKGINNRI